MNNTNITIVTFGNLDSTNIKPLTQWDKGQILEFTDQFEDGTEVQFSNGYVDSINKVLIDNKVEVPNKLLEDSYMIKAWVKVVKSDSETTIKEVKIPITSRSKPEDYVSPDDEQTFRQYVEEIMTATKSIAEDVQDRADNGEFDGFSPTAVVTKEDDGVTITIEDRNGTTSEKVLNGEKGFSPSIETEKVENKTKISITNETGVSETYISDGVVPVYNEESDYVVFKNAQQLEADGLISAIYGGES